LEALGKVMLEKIIFFTCLAAILFNFSGYIFVLQFFQQKNKKKKQKINKKHLQPKVHIIVPFFNEIALIKEKMQNIEFLDYPKKDLKVVFVDGGSTDGGEKFVKDWIEKEENRFFEFVNGGGKILQLNHALSNIPDEDFVVITDVDSIVQDKNAIRIALNYFELDNVGLVGGWARPLEEAAMGLEIAYWDKQNRLRYLETKAGTSSIVTAQFYMFRKKLLHQFPSDCLADDVYVAFQAHKNGEKVIYAHEIDVLEVRQPSNLKSLFWHKLRKANAYSIELLRELYLLPHMKRFEKFLYLYKMFQFFHLPWISVLFLGSTIALLMEKYHFTVLLSYVLLLISIFSASFSLKPPEHRIRGGLRLHSALYTIGIFSLVNFVLILNSLLYPFWRQNKIYERIKA
jgi:cellulose synthase/poly-beta-1,6-N-acetylglucosamine synthase-like glycosyltransferase